MAFKMNSPGCPCCEQDCILEHDCRLYDQEEGTWTVSSSEISVDESDAIAVSPNVFSGYRMIQTQVKLDGGARDVPAVEDIEAVIGWRSEDKSNHVYLKLWISYDGTGSGTRLYSLNSELHEVTTLGGDVTLETAATQWAQPVNALNTGVVVLQTISALVHYDPEKGVASARLSLKWGYRVGGGGTAVIDLYQLIFADTEVDDANVSYIGTGDVPTDAVVAFVSRSQDETSLSGSFHQRVCLISNVSDNGYLGKGSLYATAEISGVTGGAYDCAAAFNDTFETYWLLFFDWHKFEALSCKVGESMGMDIIIVPWLQISISRLDADLLAKVTFTARDFNGIVRVVVAYEKLFAGRGAGDVREFDEELDFKSITVSTTSYTADDVGTFDDSVCRLKVPLQP